MLQDVQILILILSIFVLYSTAVYFVFRLMNKIATSTIATILLIVQVTFFIVTLCSILRNKCLCTVHFIQIVKKFLKIELKILVSLRVCPSSF